MSYWPGGKGTGCACGVTRTCAGGEWVNLVIYMYIYIIIYKVLTDGELVAKARATMLLSIATMLQKF